METTDGRPMMQVAALRDNEVSWLLKNCKMTCEDSLTRWRGQDKVF